MVYGKIQVSNWFINARVRLWKPMVEEMYMEEVKEHEQNGSAEKTSKSEQNNGEDSASKSSMEKNPPGTTTTENPNKRSCFSFNQDHLQNTPSVSISTASTSPTGLSTRNHTGFALIGSPEMDSSIPQGNSPKKPRSSPMLHSPNNYSSTNTDEDGFTLMGAPTNFIGGFGSYPIGDIGRFSSEQFAAAYSGNNTGVSLTLGLPHCENLSISGTHQSFLPNQNIQLGRRVEIGGQHHDHHFGAAAATATATANTTPTSSHSANVYEGINHHNRKRFADYVA